MKYIFFIVLFCICFSNIGLAQQKKLSLSEALIIGLENNYQIKISKKEVRQAEISNNFGYAGGLPRINLSLSSNNTFYEDTAYTLTNAVVPAVSLNWVLFDGFSAQIRKDRFEELQALSENMQALLVENTIQSIILAYHRALLEKEIMMVLEDVMKLSQDRFNREKISKELGGTVTYNLLLAENNYLDDKSSYILQENNYRGALRNLNLLLADTTNIVYSLSDSLEITPFDYVLSDLKEQVFSSNKNLISQYLNQQILSLNSRLQRNEALPTLSLASGAEYQYGRRKIENRNSFTAETYTFYANLSLSMTLFNGGTIQINRQLAEIDEQIGTLEIEELEHTLTNRLLNIYEEYEARKEVLKVADESLKAAELNLRISEDKFKSGVINSFNYRDIQLNYLNTAVNRYTALFNLVSAHTDLLRITGGIISFYGEE